MKGIREISGKVFPLDRDHVDTDQIIPKQFLKKIDRQGFGQFLFFHWRYDDDGELRKDFHLDDAKYAGASIIVGGENFGCGSSREHAPWALQDFGFEVVIAPSFADIFYNNCLKNGILPINLEHTEVETLLEKGLRADYSLTVNLEQQTVHDGEGFESTFEIDPYWKQMLLNGWDEISITLSYEEQIEQYEKTRQE
ncbi:3-isopropylmalate dehydratase small subunit [Pseudalkalibacillus salsuginis]|uniref:3-isopropylmalate dehydratase small subunit n=1 Tax=Pseudalkalibacillus salsuginis TaxID=2910972 RepID=UPI001F39FA23|nr:3-isopropylmalate dehydratase small subunit [Pseudalkalibacillus salsuginis]MCF6411477.1 3-isopropylmalate dehydratase small subunit [Pseudalkalibacillus salsuginis]